MADPTPEERAHKALLGDFNVWRFSPDCVPFVAKQIREAESSARAKAFKEEAEIADKNERQAEQSADDMDRPDVLGGEFVARRWLARAEAHRHDAKEIRARAKEAPRGS